MTSSNVAVVSRRARFLRAALVCAAGAAMSVGAASAARASDALWGNLSADLFWNSSSLNWGAGNPWSNLGDGAIFGAAGVGSITIGEPVVVRSISFTNTSGSYTISGSAGNTLTFTNAGSSTLGAGVISVATAGVNATINAPIVSPIALNKLGLGNLTLAGPAASITGSQQIATSGKFVNFMVGSFTDRTSNYGTVSLGSDAVLSTSTVGIGNGTLDIGSSNSVVLGGLVFGGLSASNTTGSLLSGTGTFSVATNEIVSIGNTSNFGNRITANLSVPSFLGLSVGSGSNSNNEIQLLGTISGPGKIAYSSGLSNTGTTTSGGITISGNNTGWSGGLEIFNTSASGVLIGSDTALGTGDLTISGSSCTITAGSARNIANNLVLNGNLILAASTVNTAGTTDLNTTGASVTRTITVTGTQVGLNGQVLQSGGGTAGLTKAGAGTLVLGAMNSYTGTTTVSGGTLSANAMGSVPGAASVAGSTTLNANAAGSVVGPIALSGTLGIGADNAVVMSTNVGALGTIAAIGANRTMNSPIAFTSTTSSQLTGGGSFDLESSGPVDLNTTATSGLTRNITNASPRVLTFSGVVSNSGANAGLTKMGTGTLVLSNTANTFTGGISVSNGTLGITSNGSLGNSSNVLSMTGGTLRFDAAGVNVTRNITNSSGSTYNTSLFGGMISGIISGSGSVTATGGNTLTLTGVNTNTGSLNVSAGATSAGGLTIGGSGTQTAISTIGVTGSATLRPALTLDNTGTAVSNRFGATGKALTLNNGEFSVLGNAGADVSNILTTLSVSASSTNNRVSLSLPGLFNNTLTFSSLSIGSGSQITFAGDNLGNSSGPFSRILFATSPVTVSGAPIANVFFTNGGAPVQAAYDTARGVIAFAPAITVGTVIDNFGTDATAPVGGPVNAFADFTLSSDGIAKLGASVWNLTLNGDLGTRAAIAGYGASATNNNTAGMTLAIGNQLTSMGSPRTISVSSGGNSIISTTKIDAQSDLTIATGVGLSGGSGLVVNKTGAGTLNVNSTNSTATAWNVNGGTLSLNAASAIPTGSVVTVASGANFNANSGGTQSVTSIAGAGLVSTTTSGTNLTVAGSAASFTGTVSIGSGSTMTLTSTSAQTFTGSFGGAGVLAYNPSTATQLTLGGNSPMFGGTVQTGAAGRIIMTSPTAIGSALVNVSAQTASSSASTPTVGFNFGANSSTVLANNFQLATTAIDVFFAQNNSAATPQVIRLDGVISGGIAAGTTRFVWEESGSSQANVLILNNPNNTFRGVLRPQFGTLAITSDGALGNVANTVDLNSNAAATGGSLRFDANNITLAATRTVIASNTNGGASINTNGNNATINGPLTSSSTSTSFTKIGAGTLILANASNTITSAITVSGGALAVNGGVAGSGTSTAATITVNTGATLGGSGSVGTGTAAATARNVSIANGGTLSPGNSAGIFTINGTVNALSLAVGSTYLVELNGPTIGSGYDSTTVNGGVTLSGTAPAGPTLNVALNYLPASSLTDVYWILVNDGTDLVTGIFANAPEGSTVSIGTFSGVPYTAQVSYRGNFEGGQLIDGSGNDIVLFNIVPAPGAAGMLGLAGLLAVRRRRR
jgi:autotransporter-associated beta strand protein